MSPHHNRFPAFVPESLLVDFVAEQSGGNDRGSAEAAGDAVDGPGQYGGYGLTGEETFTFSCNGAPDTYETHTYTLRTVGGGPVDSETLNVSAKVNEIEIV